MTDTANLALPFIDGSQAQKHITHNEALRILDAAVQVGVVDMTLTAPPSAPADGERHVVASGPTGAWAGQAKAIAVWEDGAWRFLTPKSGWLVWSAADESLFVFDGSAWGAVSSGGGGGGGGGSSTLDNVPHVGINATATSPNLLSVCSNAALFNAIDAADGGTGDARLQISKEAAANTASVFFSDGFSGRAEFGLTGDDDFHLKVSADGTAWRDAVKFDRTTGIASFPSGADVGPFGYRNRVINPSGQINQAGTGTAADGAYWFDQWVVLTQSNPITPSQITSAENGTPFMMRYTQSNASAQRFGIIQPIEFANCIDLRGQAITLSARVRMSAATTLRYAIVEWTGTADSITKDVVNDWTNGTFTPGNFFNSSNLTVAAKGSVALSANTLTSIALTGTVSGSMNNILVFFWTDSAQAQNVTLDIGKAQLEIGSSTTPIAFRTLQQEEHLAFRYFQKSYEAGTMPGAVTQVGALYFRNQLSSDPYSTLGNIQFVPTMRVIPTITFYSPSSGTTGKGWNNVTGDVNAQTEGNLSAKRASVSVNNTTVFAPGANMVHITANARL